MRHILIIFFIFLFSLTVISCSSEDDSALKDGKVAANLSEVDQLEPPYISTFTINDSSAATNQTAVSVKFSGTDAVGITGYIISNQSTSPDLSNSDWVSITSQTQYNIIKDSTVGPSDASYSLYGWMKDAANNISASSSASIYYDTTAPAISSVSINSGDSSTSNTVVNLTVSASDSLSGIAAYYASESSSAPSATATVWVDITTTNSLYSTVSFTLSSYAAPGSYIKTVYLWVKDVAGNVSSSFSDSITLIVPDITAPSNPSITINGGDSSTDNSSVILSLSASDDVGIVGYYISTTGSTPSSNASGWTAVTSNENYTDNISYNLTGAAESVKTLYARFKDADENISSVVSDSIIYCSSGTNAVDEVEPNNSLSTAMTFLCPNYHITGGYDGYSAENSSYPNDYFKVTASSNTMTVSLSHVSALAANSDFEVDVYNSSGTRIDDFDADNGVNNQIELWVTSGASYYIRVRGNYQTTFKYKLKIQFSTTSGSLELDTPNGTMATAVTLTDNTTMRGEKNGSSDGYDYYKITAPSGKTSMNVALSHDNASASGSDNYITVYRWIAEGTTPTVQEFSSLNGVNDNRTFGIIEGDTYYIRIGLSSSFGSSSGGYTRYRYGLLASFGTEVYELEQNNSTTAAHSITAGTTYTGGYDGYSAENSSYPNDYFKVTASSNTMTVSLSHVSALAANSDFEVDVYNSSGTRIDDFDADNGVNGSNNTTVTSGQLYYIRVRGNYQTTYKYNINASF